MNEHWEQVGSVGVDSGTLWVGDPCYIMPDDAEDNPGGDWHEFVSQSAEPPFGFPATKEWLNKNGASIGVLVCNFGGDGSYPVSIQRNEDGLVTEVRIELFPSTPTRSEGSGRG